MFDIYSPYGWFSFTILIEMENIHYNVSSFTSWPQVPCS